MDSERPEGSLMVFGNGCISPGELYQFPPGLRCGLVVLSACQTGLGRRHPDSLIGLANAFLIAGAQAVVATLWKVPDDATRTLMDDFYQGLADGLSAAAALRHAQQQALESPTRADPFCWAAPVLTGMGDACFALTPKAWETMGAPSNE
jgi:CHAT domain-containing protein